MSRARISLKTQEEKDLFKMLMSGLPDKVQCSNTKSGRYKLNIPKVVALLNYKFVQFQHPKKYQWLSVDVDDRNTLTNFQDIITTCVTANLPIPTLVVETNKGWHIHWYLDEALWKNNKLHKAWRDRIKAYMGGVLGGDKHAAGFIMRNPFLHKYLFNTEAVYYISDFENIVSLEEVKQEMCKDELEKMAGLKKVKKTKKFYDWRKVKEGERNITLTEYIRSFMFRNFEDFNVDDFLTEALNVNSLMRKPLPVKEVKSTVYSVYKFVSKNYIKGFKKKDQAAYNRKVAKFNAQKTYLKILTNILNLLREDKVSLLKLVREYYSFRALARMAGVNHKTIKKYLKKLKEDIVRIVKNKGKVLVDIVEFSFRLFRKGVVFAIFSTETKPNNNLYKIGVLKC